MLCENALHVKTASAGSRTRIECLEGIHANRYTTLAAVGGLNARESSLLKSKSADQSLHCTYCTIGLWLHLSVARITSVECSMPYELTTQQNANYA